jgi:LmbE family N-acetylglucosaminyl deacetylase
MTEQAPPQKPAAAPHDWLPARFMVIAAHPDDADFGPAATAAAWIDQGSVGWLVCCTSGDQGGEDPNMDPLELAAIREREQRAAAQVVGYAGVTFLHMPDGALVNDLILREHLVREIRTFKPDAVLATDPENTFPRGTGVNHTDHRAAGWAAADAVYPAARNPMAFPWLAKSGLQKHVVRRLYFFWTHRPNAYVDISSTIGRKLDALRCHESQIKDFTEIEKWMAEWSGMQGKEIGVANAEGLFHVVIDEDDVAPEAAVAEEAAAVQA